MKAIVAERGQVTIPKELRTKLGIKPGTVLDFQIKDFALVAMKAEHGTDPLQKAYGCLNLNSCTDDFIKELRGESDYRN